MAKAYNYKPAKPTKLQKNEGYIGETLEQKIRRVVNNKEPIQDGAPIIYTKREDGVRPETDIRTDRWEVAAEAMDYVGATHLAKRQERIDARIVEMKPKDGGAEPPQATTQS